jgi:hypothetical protein
VVLVSNKVIRSIGNPKFYNVNSFLTLFRPGAKQDKFGFCQNKKIPHPIGWGMSSQLDPVLCEGLVEFFNNPSLGVALLQDKEILLVVDFRTDSEEIAEGSLGNPLVGVEVFTVLDGEDGVEQSCLENETTDFHGVMVFGEQ